MTAKIHIFVNQRTTIPNGANGLKNDQERRFFSLFACISLSITIIGPAYANFGALASSCCFVFVGRRNRRMVVEDFSWVAISGANVGWNQCPRAPALVNGHPLSYRIGELKIHEDKDFQILPGLGFPCCLSTKCRSLQAIFIRTSGRHQEVSVGSLAHIVSTSSLTILLPSISVIGTIFK